MYIITTKYRPTSIHLELEKTKMDYYDSDMAGRRDISPEDMKKLIAMYMECHDVNKDISTNIRSMLNPQQPFRSFFQIRRVTKRRVRAPDLTKCCETCHRPRSTKSCKKCSTPSPALQCCLNCCIGCASMCHVNTVCSNCHTDIGPCTDFCRLDRLRQISDKSLNTDINWCCEAAHKNPRNGACLCCFKQHRKVGQVYYDDSAKYNIYQNHTEIVITDGHGPPKHAHDLFDRIGLEAKIFFLNALNQWMHAYRDACL